MHLAGGAVSTGVTEYGPPAAIESGHGPVLLTRCNRPPKLLSLLLQQAAGPWRRGAYLHAAMYRRVCPSATTYAAYLALTGWSPRVALRKRDGCVSARVPSSSWSNGARPRLGPRGVFLAWRMSASSCLRYYVPLGLGLMPASTGDRSP